MTDGIPLSEWSGSGATRELQSTIERLEVAAAKQARTLLFLTWVLVVLTALMTLGVGVQIWSSLRTSTPAQSPPPNASDSSNVPAVSWERARQCADQVERLATREGWSKQSRAQEVKVAGWFNHYNAKSQRCYVQVAMINEAATKNKELPLFLYTLYDAFETRELASCTDASNSQAATFCSILDGPETRAAGDCAACRKFVRDLMYE